MAPDVPAEGEAVVAADVEAPKPKRRRKSDAPAVAAADSSAESPEVTKPKRRRKSDLEPGSEPPKRAPRKKKTHVIELGNLPAIPTRDRQNTDIPSIVVDLEPGMVEPPMDFAPLSGSYADVMAKAMDVAASAVPTPAPKEPVETFVHEPVDRDAPTLRLDNLPAPLGEAGPMWVVEDVRPPEPQIPAIDAPPQYVASRPLHATYANRVVRVLAIDRRTIVVSDMESAAIGDEGPFMLRADRSFPELSRFRARVVGSQPSGDGEFLVTLQPCDTNRFLNFMVTALIESGAVYDRDAGLPQQVSPLPSDVEPPQVAEDPLPPPTADEEAAGVITPRRQHLPAELLIPTRALPATFGDVRAAVLDMSGSRIRLAHSKAIEFDEELPFTIHAEEVGNLSGCAARIVTTESLQEHGRTVYVTTVDVTRNTMALGFFVQTLVEGGLLKPKRQTATRPRPIETPHAAAAAATPAPSFRDNLLAARPATAPVALPPPAWKPLPSAPRKANFVVRPVAKPVHNRTREVIVAIAILFAVTMVAVAQAHRPDPHFLRAKQLIDDYETGLPADQRDYTQPVYIDALNELAMVSRWSVSHEPALKLAAEIRAAMAMFRNRQHTHADAFATAETQRETRAEATTVTDTAWRAMHTTMQASGPVCPDPQTPQASPVAPITQAAR